MSDEQRFSVVTVPRIGVSGTLILLMATSGFGGGTEPAPFCTLIPPGPGLRAGAAQVLALATDSWSAVSGEEYPYQEFWRNKFHGLAVRQEGDRLVETEESRQAALALAEADVPGQEFVVLEVHQAAQLDVPLGTLVTVVPWGYLPSCTYRPFEEEEWVTPGDTVVFQLRRTRNSDAWVFDVTAAHDPYPRYVWDSRPRRDDGSLISPWLTPVQHWEFLTLFPRPLDEMGPADQRALENAVSTWAREAGLLDTYPVRAWIERRQR